MLWFERLHRSYGRPLGVLIILLKTGFACAGEPVAPGQANKNEVEVRDVRTVTPASQHFEKDGVAIDFSLSPISGGAKDLLLARFEIRDARTGAPLNGLRPRAWMAARHSEQLAHELACSDKVRGFAKGGLSTRPEADLNKYLLLTLNHDKTISVINPLVAFNLTKLESLIQLPGLGSDWVLTEDQNDLYVTLPEQGGVAVIDTLTQTLVQTLPFAEGAKPGRITRQPDGRYIWVGLDGMAQVAVIDPRQRRLVKLVPVGNGAHDVRFTHDSRFALVSNHQDASVSIIDIGTLEPTFTLKLAAAPSELAYSKHSRRAYAVTPEDTAITVIDPEHGEIAGGIPAERGITRIGFEPEGRFGVALNRGAGRALVFDTASNAVVTTTSVVAEPDQLSFTADYAYIQGAGSDKLSLLPLNNLRAGRPAAPLTIQAGRSAVPSQARTTGMIAPTPDGNAVMLANASDSAIYYYVEGMMAPMGTFQNDGRLPRGLMILDRSLKEIAPAVYATTVSLQSSGRFDVPMVIEQPRVVSCFQVKLEGFAPLVKQNAKTSLAIEYITDAKDIQVSQPVQLSFKITESPARSLVPGLRDVQLLVFQPPGVWQQRRMAEEVEPGIYAVKQTFPRAGIYQLMLAVASRGKKFTDTSPVELQIGSNTQAAGPNTVIHVKP